MIEANLTPDILIDEIQMLIPHRFPMLLLDKVVEVNAPESGVGIKNVTINEWFFQGHFPNRPVMPGVLIVEAMAQTAGVLVTKSMQNVEDDKVVYFMTIDSARFRKPVVPGDVLRMKVQKQRARSNVWKFEGVAMVNDQVVAEAVFSAMIAVS
jgi:3-hydroxyacyl-[acyl-carrier-protein] dehydratase